MFELNESKIPNVEFLKSWELEDGTENHLYQAGNWSFESGEDHEVEYAESAIYAWIAWYNFLQQDDQKEAS